MCCTGYHCAAYQRLVTQCTSLHLMFVLRSDADPTTDSISNTDTVAADWGPVNAAY
jgi:hypothetical protein